MKGYFFWPLALLYQVIGGPKRTPDWLEDPDLEAAKIRQQKREESYLSSPPDSDQVSI